MEDIASLGRFQCIVADPPWPITFGEDANRHKRKSTGGPKGTWSAPHIGYKTMSLDEIARLSVRSVAAESAHLYLWTINKYIRDAYDIATTWGFSPSCLLTWAKTPRGLGLGGTFVQTTEHILFARKGTLKAFKRVDSSWWNWKRPESVTGPMHSRKPPEMQTMVEEVSPGPYLELFARRPRKGWTVWGDEV